MTFDSKTENRVWLDYYRQMLKIRVFEEKALEMYSLNKIYGSLHLYIGEEAVAVGVCSTLEKDDYITSTHRGHGHCIAKGGDLNRMMAELLGKETGYCKGKGGSMHITDINLGHLGANGIVGGGLTIATGAALAIKIIRDTDQVVVCFFGDGALDMGEFHESLNLASLWKLPVIFVCENNLYALSNPLGKASSQIDTAKKAIAYNMPGNTVDGMDVLAVREVAQIAVKRAREGDGPTLIMADTYRFFGHSRSDPCIYRTKEEEDKWKSRCPLKTFAKKLIEEKVVSEDELLKIKEELLTEVNEAVKFADNSPYPKIEGIELDVYA